MGLNSDRAERIRPWLLGILILGLVGTETELVLLKHYEEATQWAPIALIAVTALVLAWNAIGRGAASLRVLKTLMWLFRPSAIWRTDGRFVFGVGVCPVRASIRRTRGVFAPRVRGDPDHFFLPKILDTSGVR